MVTSGHQGPTEGSRVTTNPRWASCTKHSPEDRTCKAHSPLEASGPGVLARSSAQSAEGCPRSPHLLVRTPRGRSSDGELSSTHRESNADENAQHPDGDVRAAASSRQSAAHRGAANSGAQERTVNAHGDPPSGCRNINSSLLLLHHTYKCHFQWLHGHITNGEFVACYCGLNKTVALVAVRLHKRSGEVTNLPGQECISKPAIPGGKWVLPPNSHCTCFSKKVAGWGHLYFTATRTLEYEIVSLRLPPLLCAFERATHRPGTSR